MVQKLFISFNAKDRTKAHWIAWTLRHAGHEVAVHDWEIPAGGNAPLWMNQKLAWADRLIAVVSPDYIRASYSATEWAASLWDDPDGAKGAVIPVVVRAPPKLPPLLRGLSHIDLTGCDEAEAQRRLLRGVERPQPPARKPAFEAVEPQAPAPEEYGPSERPAFAEVRVTDGVPRWLKLAAAIAGVLAALFAGIALFTGGGTTERACTTNFGGITVCGDVKGDIKSGQ